MFFVAKELIDLPGLPVSIRRIQMYLKESSNEKQRRVRKGAKGAPFEYHIDCLPEETKVYLLQSQAKEIAEEQSNSELRSERKSVDEVWYEYDNATSKVKARAQQRLEAALLVHSLMERGKTKKVAMQMAGELTEFTARAIKKWFYVEPKLNKIDKLDWLPYLATTQGRKAGDGKTVEFSEDAQRFFKTAYLKPDVTVASARRLTVEVALKNGWIVPNAAYLRKWILTNIPHELRVLLREGKAAAQQSLVPSQRRTRMGMHALELVNGDGHTFRVQCELESGKIIRPTVWVFQDVYSSAIVGYSIDISENNEMLSIAIANMIKAVGLPGGWVFDRGSAALSDLMTGSMVKPGKDGKYKKFSTSELEGLLQTLGYSSSDISWTGVIEDNVGNKGNARGKPVERLFRSSGGIGDFEKRPEFEGCYTGKNIMSKPANYEGGKRGVPFHQLCELFDKWVIDYNNEMGRRTEMAKGTKSYQQVFNESYAVSQIKRPTPEQIRLCLLRQESVMVRPSGLFELMASKYKAKTDSHYKTNRYASPMLYDYIGERVSVRYNPYNMHSEVYAYDKKGVLIGPIPIIEDQGYASLSAKRLQAIVQGDTKNRVDLLVKDADLLGKEHFEAMLKDVEKNESGLGSVIPGITEMVPGLVTRLDGFEKVTAKAPLDDDEWAEDDTNIINAMFKTFQPAIGE
ncbi:transposase domain-containing protein [Vibrio sp. OPT18]|uniref:transposase domain-containing protein n=1 Tax=Vibrio sp. OPT18 TaxID=2778641 RepID=UPI00187EA9E6|nr:transposase domain-containing protein [Vibrio sp. OPT18]MBE8578683.1 Mu transposase C-terminal domain-containing protein [Vibrio sp. OPT18]